MTEQPGTATPRRRRPMVIGAVLLGALLIVVAVLFAVDRPEQGTPIATPAAPDVTASQAASATPSSSSSVPAATKLADGCLGGPDPFAAILPAQQAATQDIRGAAALARTFGRWSVTYPIDPAAPEVLRAIVAPGNPYEVSALQSLNELARNLQSRGYTESKVIPGQGAYRVQPGSSNTSVSLDLILNRQLTRSDGRTEEMKMAITVLLQRTENGPWFISGTLPPLGPDPFASSATVPWQSYEAPC